RIYCPYQSCSSLFITTQHCGTHLLPTGITHLLNHFKELLIRSIMDGGNNALLIMKLYNLPFILLFIHLFPCRITKILIIREMGLLLCFRKPVYEHITFLAFIAGAAAGPLNDGIGGCKFSMQSFAGNI